MKVIYFDFELMTFEIRDRLNTIHSALGELGNCHNLRIIALREYAEEFLANMKAVKK